MDRLNRNPFQNQGWAPPNQNLNPPAPFANSPQKKIWNPTPTTAVPKPDFDLMVQQQLQMLSNQTNPNQSPKAFNYTNKPTMSNFTCDNRNVSNVTKNSCNIENKYDPFLEDNMEDMEISDDENPIQSKKETIDSGKKASGEKYPLKPPSRDKDSKGLKSGSAFYQGLILYIPPFEQVKHSYRGSPSVKMLYASFEFSFKLPIKMESKPTVNDPNMMDVSITFQNNAISTASGPAAHILASVRALEVLSETCYTIQAKEDYYLKSTLIDAENLRTLDLKKWEAVCLKYPKLLEMTKDGHIQKTLALFLDSHTSSGVYEDVILSNLTRQDVSHIKSIAEFFHLTMLPCSVATNLSKKSTPCVLSFHKYTTAQKLLDILNECGGENDKFKVFPPDTFKDFYKLMPNYWDPKLGKQDSSKEENQTSLDSEENQAVVMKPYENIISELFEKHKLLPKKFESNETPTRKAGDDFMKEKLQIDVSNSKNVAPVERMQLLLKYMEQLQEYGSRVLISGKTEMIKIYHNAIENLRKDLDSCRQDLEKEQKNQTVIVIKETEKTQSFVSKSSSPKRKTPLQKRPVSPLRRSQRSPRRQVRKSPSPRRRPISKSPQRRALPRPLPPRNRPPSTPRRRPLSPPSRRPPSPSSRRPPSPPSRRPPSPSRRRPPSPKRASSPKRPSSPKPPLPKRAPSPKRFPPSRPNTSQPFSSGSSVLISIFRDQFKRYLENLRRFRIEVEDTPIERRATLKENLLKYRAQLNKFQTEAKQNPRDLGEFMVEMEICRDELEEQTDMINGKPGPNDLPRGITPPPWMASNSSTFEPSQMPVSYPLPGARDVYGARIPPPPSLYNPPRLQTQHPTRRFPF